MKQERQVKVYEQKVDLGKSANVLTTSTPAPNPFVQSSQRPTVPPSQPSSQQGSSRSNSNDKT